MCQTIASRRDALSQITDPLAGCMSLQPDCGFPLTSVFTIAARKEIVQGVVSVKITKTIAIEAAFYILKFNCVNTTFQLIFIVRNMSYINAFTSNIS